MRSGRKATPANEGPVEGPWDLPDGWRWERLGRLVQKQSAKHTPDPTSQLDFVGMESIRSQELTVTEFIPFKEMRSMASAFELGDVLYGRLRPYLNKVWIADRAGACSGELLVLRPCADAAAGYLALNLHSSRFVDFASYAVTGDRPRIDFDQMAQFQIPVPPVGEQARILRHLERLFDEIDEGDAALKEARAATDLYRQAVLKAAVTGDLTADWRASNRSDETGEALLDRVLSARRERWEARPENANKRYREPIGSSLVGLPSLPSTWTWASVDQLTIQIRNGTSLKPIEAENGIPILRISAVRPMLVQSEQVRMLAPDAKLGDLFVSAGDFLATRYSGSPQYVGVVAKYRSDVSIAYPDKLIRLRMWDDDKGHTDFMEIALNSFASRRFIMANIKTTAGQHGISGGSLAQAPVPVPPKGEADEIVRRVKKALEAIPPLNAVAAGTAQELRQSILTAAFRGTLITEAAA